VRPWLSFGFMTTGDVNGLHAHPVNAVYWTLAYEWMFYLALPLLALFARGPLSLLVLAGVLFFGTQAPIVFNFLFGALVAVVVHSGALQGRLRAWWLAPVPLLALAGYFAVPGAALLQAGLLGVFFVFVAHGDDLFGLLRTRAAYVLGTISYSLYLTHSIVLYVVVRLVDRAVPVVTLDVAQYWLVAGVAALATVALSSLTYRRVEFPFLRRSSAARAFAPSMRGPASA